MLRRQRVQFVSNAEDGLVAADTDESDEGDAADAAVGSLADADSQCTDRDRGWRLQ